MTTPDPYRRYRVAARRPRGCRCRSCEAYCLPLGFDDRDDALFVSRVRPADVLGGQLVDDRPRGVAFEPLDHAAADLLMVMAGWGDKWLAGEAGPPVLYRHHACGEVSGVDLRCAHCGEPMHANDVDPLPGPGAAV